MHDLRWSIEKLGHKLALIEPLVFREQYSLPAFRYHRGPERLVDVDIADDRWPSVLPGSYWGGRNEEFTLRTSFRSLERSGALPALLLPIGQGSSDFPHPEALAYIDGAVWMSVDKYHQELPLPDSCHDGGLHTLALHGWCGDRDEQVRMGQPSLVLVDSTTRDLWVRARVALETLGLLGEGDPTRYRLAEVLEEAFAALDLREPLAERFYDSARVALATLHEGLQQAGPPLGLDLFATGHAHIDVAWLWDLRQTRSKVARSWSNVLRLMERFPELRFTQSQPQLYAFLRQEHPQLFAEVQARASEGRWEPTGGMWVEADCVLSGAEALVRQLILGQAFFREHFGAGASPILWLPDSFGYTWSLPQLMSQAGLPFFLTTKLSWNEENHFPYDSFWWQGIDGSKVLAHCVTTPHRTWSPFSDRAIRTYNGTLTPAEALGTWHNLQQKSQKTMLTLYGWGDGGGGPTREMLEMARSLERHPGLPRLRHASAHEFFCTLREQAAEQLPTWNGELYLEYHRGIYTSQAATKRANRKSEVSLHTTEFLAAWAAQLAGLAYPHTELRRAWELLCLNQFHDILPGSSIAAVYAESREQYAEIARLAADVQERALSALEAHAPAGDLLLFNPAPFARSEPLLVAAPQGPTPAGAQVVDAGLLIPSGTVPAYGCRALSFANLPALPDDLSVARAEDGGWLLQNGYLLVAIGPSGDITRIFDRQAGREVLAPGLCGNLLQAFEDRPVEFDAWNVERYYEDHCWEAEPADEVQLLEEGPLRATVKVGRRILQSRLVQRISLCAGSPRLDFETFVDWQERHTLLKVAFPVDVLAPRATYEIQWGAIERSTHRNTSWEQAQFEVWAHKWADLSEGDYGVSLLNDCKYGYDIRDNLLRLTLLRGASDPDPQADLGEHHFIYSLLPHRGDWREATAQHAYALNYPLLGHRPRQPGGRNGLAELVAVDASHVIIETIKQAEDGRGLIVRLYESQRRRGDVVVAAAFPLAQVERCNLLEEPGEPLPAAERSVRLSIKPYEIITLRLVPC